MSGHRMSWQDDRMAGVDCFVRKQPNSVRAVELGGPATVPSYGGVVEAGEERACESCGAKLRLVWNVRLEEVAP